MTLNILILLDDNYIDYASAMLESLFENNREESISVYIIRDDMPTEKGIGILRGVIDRFDNGELKLVQIDKDFKAGLDGFNLKRWPVETFFRIYSPWILDASVERILYLDTDTIVNGSLAGLYASELNGRLIGACRDTAILSFGNRLKQGMVGKSPEEFLSLVRCSRADAERECICPVTREYYNSGVLLLDLKGLRDRYRAQELIDYTYSINDYLIYPDQDFINFFFADEILALDPMLYNCQTGSVHYREEANVLRNARIMHFTGGRPWNSGYRRHYSSAVRGDIWWRYALRAGVRSGWDYFRWKASNLMLTGPWMLLYNIREAVRKRVSDG